ncbi:MAG: hypothetical protein IPM99_19180 [Rubrivivax sp.]|nr:hypothetical protein [Rubrivivax sp.]
MIAIERAPAVAPAASGAWWRTSSFGDMQAASAHELSTLGEHLQACRLGGGGLFSVGCGAQALHRHVASRFVTTLALALLVIGLGMLAT